MAKDALVRAAESLFGLMPGKEPLAEALAQLPEPTLSQRHYLWTVLRKHELTLRMVGIKTPPEPIAPPQLPSEPHFIDFINGKFILRLHPAHAEQIHMIPKAKYDRKTQLYSVPYRMQPTVSLHKFVKQTGMFCTDATKQAVLDMYQEMRERYKASRAHDADIEMEGFGLALDPFQKAGIKGALRFKRGFIADDMGLGKTRQALGVLFKAAAYPALIICPASLPLNWAKEAAAGLPGKRIWVATNRKMPKHTCSQKQLSILDADKFDDSCSLCCFWVADIIVANYDKIAEGWKGGFDENGKKIKGWKREKGERAEVKLSELGEALRTRGIRALVVDESHYVKNAASQRTKGILALVDKVEIRLALSGTPIKNRPSELSPQLQILDRLDDLGGYDVFHRRYCAAAEKTKGGQKVFDTSGSSNEPELNKLLRSIGFIQRNKRDVLKDLPPLREGVIWVDIDNWPEYEYAEKQIVNWCAEQAILKEEFVAMLAKLPPDLHDYAKQKQQIETRLRVMKAQAMVRITALKKIVALGKLAASKEIISDFIQSGKPVVIFAHHREVQKAVVEEFNFLHIYGSDNLQDRQRSKEVFQGEWTGPPGPESTQGIVCSFGAAREGITLTAASDIYLFEQQWTPADESQAIARVDRYGQLLPVNAFRVLADKTIDNKIYDLLQSKREIVDAVTRGEVPLDAAKLDIVDELMGELAGMSTIKISREDVIRAHGNVATMPPEMLQMANEGSEEFLEAAV